MSPELINFATQGAWGLVFFWLYWRTNEELQKQAQRHDQEMARLWELRIQELRLMARIPTNLEGVPPAQSMPSLSSPLSPSLAG
jgi:hypothetical protein